MVADAKVPISADNHPVPGVWGALKETYAEFSDDGVMTHAAAIAFYSGLAIAPLLALVVWISRVFFGNEAKQTVLKAFQEVIGSQAAAPIQEILDPATSQTPHGLNVAGVISTVILAFSAASVFGQLQTALNQIWDVKAKPRNSVMGFISKRLLSLGMLFSLMFLLMVSLVLSAILHNLLGRIADEQTLIWLMVNHATALGLFMVLFAALFKYVPDAKVHWRVVWIGAFASAALFSAGKLALAWYLGRGSYETSYGGAVGSFVALLVWVYYSSITVLIGAEATEVYARRHGLAVEPSEHAVHVVRQEREQPKTA
jgi:membrane protein